ncbi:MAG: PTS fructose transporter subunit IIB [Erysipelotrichaceae bacterium]|nr:PTS fructose transporter subunit IIB [Erysipelotrichaceae bacterium]
MKSCTVVTVCGSGVVTSSMIALKIKDQLREKGWDATMFEASPVSLSSVITGKDIDVIVCASPVTEDVGIPKVKGMGMVTGMGEEKVINEIIAVLEEKHKD